MKPLTIFIDMDDTIEYLLKGWVDWLNAKHGTDVDWTSIRTWDMTKAFPTLNKMQVYEPLYVDDFWDWVKPIPYATEMIHQLIVDGHKVFIVTASTYETLAAKMDKVLFRYFPYLTFDNVIVTSNKQLLNGDVLIDDGIHNLVGGSYAKLIMDAPHNRGFDEKAYDMRRVHSWEEIYPLICEMAKS